jgi:diguanylate cyclase (GGDEF)-like protein
MMELDGDQLQLAKDVARRFRDRFHSSFLNVINSKGVAVGPWPEPIDNLLREIELLIRSLHQSVPVVLSGPLPSLLKLALLTERRDRAANVEERKSRTPNPYLIAAIESELSPFDQLIHRDEFRDVTPAPMPRLIEYLTLEQVQQHTGAATFPAREYDEKFHILYAPNLFLKDLACARRQCELRGQSVGVGVAFVDIDDFKKRFNTPYGEQAVDRYVLPRFMEAVEAHVYHRGYAYRFGGDEYAITIPNTDFAEAFAMLGKLQERVRALAFVGIKERITLSIGLCIAVTGCHLTDQELLDRANKAKNHAKQHGKDRIASYGGHLFDDGSLFIPGTPQG